MKKVDPAIKVIASSATPEELSWTYLENRQLGTFPAREAVNDKVPFGFGTKYDWTGALLARSAEYIDYLGEHFYGYPNLAIDWGLDRAAVTLSERDQKHPLLAQATEIF